MSVDTTVLIIGAGPSGIGTAAQIIRNFKTYDFEIIEKSNDVGGTWWLNTYPGCGCDVGDQPAPFFARD
jgi:cation diffusion facilitator CzcD-associated flavoprotein CzcO